MKYVDSDDEFMLIRKPMTHPNFIIRNYLMGELAGGEGVGRERGGEEFALGSQPSLPSLLESGNRSRTVGVCGAGLSPSQGHSSGSAALTVALRSSRNSQSLFASLLIWRTRVMVLKRQSFWGQAPFGVWSQLRTLTHSEHSKRHLSSEVGVPRRHC